MCPDCDPTGHKTSLLQAYGPPAIVNGMAFYANPQMPLEAVLSADEWARALCSKCKHKLATRRPM